jgi:hypothetical protein
VTKDKEKTMNFKQMTMLAFTLCVTLLASTAALAQRTGQISANPGTLTVAQDIAVKIEMFEDSACTKPIPNGASLSFSGGAPAAYVRFTLKNNLGVKTDNFTFKRVIERDGVKVFDPAASQITPTKRRSFRPRKFIFPARATRLKDASWLTSATSSKKRTRLTTAPNTRSKPRLCTNHPLTEKSKQ